MKQVVNCVFLASVVFTPLNPLHAQWVQPNTDLANTSVSALDVSGIDLFAGTYGGGLWRRPLSELITGIGEQKNEARRQFALDQGYPNPFNPSTTI